MAQAYTRQSSFADGDTITAALFNNEYNQLVNAFAYSSSNASTTGHRHDGTAGQGGNIPQIGDLDFLNKIVVDSTNNRWGFYVEVSSSAVEQIRLQDGALLPVTDSDVDLGTSSLYFKDAYIDSITTTGNVAVGGNLTVTGTTTFNGGTLTLGDAASDNVVFGADVDSNIIPDDDNTYDLGSSSQEWKDLYVDGIAYLDGINFNGTAITATAAELNILDGVTSTAAELNILDGVTSTAAELNILDGVTSTAAELNILDGVTSTTAELNILDGVTSSTAELNILDGVTSTTAELNILDGVTSTTAELNILDGVTATAAEINALDGITSTVAELNILDGVTASATDINLIDGITNGTVIASKAIITDANKDITGGRNITISGELDAATLDISGDADIDGTLEADAITIGGVTLAETISDTVGAMVTSNTETGVTVTYDDSDNTLDFVIGTLNQDTTGNAATATLATTTTVTDSTANTNFPVVFHDESNGLLDDTGALRYNPSTGELLVPKLTVAGTTTTADTVTMQASNAIVFEGATADANETTLSIVDPTSDHTQYLINQGGYIPVLAAATTTQISATPAELNILDGVTSTASEINLLDGSTANTVVNSKAVIYGSSGELAGTLSTAAQTNITSLGTLTTLTVDDITINGSTISDSGDLTLDVGGDIILDADGDDFIFAAGGTNIGKITNSSSDFLIRSLVQDKDIIFKGDDSGTTITALTLDMSDAGAATFNAGITSGNIAITTTGSSQISLLDSDNGFAASTINVENGGRDLKLTTPQDTIFVQGSTESMRILDGGNVGIGTTSPAEKLHVVGDVRVDTDLYIQPTNKFYLDGGNDTFITEAAANQMTFNTAGAERIRIDASGMLGLGTTPPTDSHATWSQFFIGQKGSVISERLGSGGLYGTYVTDNLYVDTDTGAFAYRVANEASAYLQEAATHRWYTVASGSAGAAATLSERMRIDSSGRLGVNTSSPTYLLNVLASAGSQNIFQAGQSGVSNGLSITTDGSALTYSFLTGNVGIGTTSPSFGSGSGLEIERSGTATLRLQDSGNKAAEIRMGTHLEFVSINSGSNMVFDATGDIILDAGGDDITFKSGGTEFGGIFKNSNDMFINSAISDGDIKFRGNDGGSFIIPMVIDMSEGGRVGIGTSSPQNTLHVNSAAENIVARFESTDTEARIQLKDDTGIAYIASRNDFRFGTDTTTERMRINNSGNVGIATSSPGQRLDVDGNITASAFIGRSNSSAPTADAAVFRAADNTLAFSTANTERLRIDSSGQVGIGTDSPSKILHLKGSAAQIRIEDSDGTNQIADIASDSGDMFLTSRNNTSHGEIIFRRYNGTSVLETARIDSSGKLGIGTTSPSAFLTLTGSEGSQYAGSFANTSAQGWGLFVQAGADNDDYSFRIRNKDATDIFSVKSGGRVGIGTASPSRNLSVLSDSFYSLELQGTNAYNNLVDTGIAFSAQYNSSNAVTDVASIRGGRFSTSDGNYAGVLKFFTRPNGGSDTERMRISYDGKVGIGETSPDASLHITSNTPTIAFEESDASQDYRIGSFGGAFAVYDSTDSAYRTVIDGSGNVGIGTTSPARELHLSATTPRFRLEDSDGGYAEISGSGGHLTLSADGGASQSASRMAFEVDGSEAMRINSDEDVLIGTTSVQGVGGITFQEGSSGYTIQQNMDGTSAGADLIVFRRNSTQIGSINQSSTNAVTYNTTSDARLKDITGSSRGLDVINNLNPVAYNWKADNHADEGLIAQEVEKLVPNAVNQDEDGYYSMDYSKLVTHLVKGMQEQQEQIKELKKDSHSPKGLEDMNGYSDLIDTIKTLRAEIAILKGE